MEIFPWRGRESDGVNSLRNTNNILSRGQKGLTTDFVVFFLISVGTTNVFR